MNTRMEELFPNYEKRRTEILLSGEVKLTRIQEIRERAQKATPGEWHVDPDGPNNVWDAGVVRSSDEKDLVITLKEQYRVPWKDAQFIAHSRQDIPFLLDYIEKMEKALELCNACVHKYGDLPPKISYWMELAGIEE